MLVKGAIPVYLWVTICRKYLSVYDEDESVTIERHKTNSRLRNIYYFDTQKYALSTQGG